MRRKISRLDRFFVDYRNRFVRLLSSNNLNRDRFGQFSPFKDKVMAVALATALVPGCLVMSWIWYRNLEYLCDEYDELFQYENNRYYRGKHSRQEKVHWSNEGF